MKLSIAMIVKNEENNLERTLIPLMELEKNIEVEIIIVDTGSTDSTVQIARKYTDKVYLHKWNNDFAQMRNISVKYCTGDWVLVLDADEVLYDIKELTELLKQNNLNKFNAVLLKRIEFSESVDYTLDYGYVTNILRLFRNNTISYEGTIHEQPKFTNPVMESNIRFLHYGYDNNDYEVMENKFKRNLNLLFEELKDNPDSVYINFQIATSYTMHHQLEEAFDYIKIAYDKAKNEIYKYLYVIDKYCFILYNMGEYKELKNKAADGIKYCEDFLDFYFYLGEAYFNLAEYHRAIDVYNKYLKIQEDFSKTLVVSNNTLSVMTRGYKNNILYNLALSYYKNKNYKCSLDTMKRIENHSLIREKVYVLFKIIIDGKLYNEINIVEKYIDKYNYENLLLYIHKEISIEVLEKVSSIKLDGNLREIVGIVKYYKENGNINKEISQKIIEIFKVSENLYSIYVYYTLKYNIENIDSLMKLGKNKIENILIKLCSNYFDFNIILSKGIERFNSNNSSSILIRTILEKALLLGGNLPIGERENVFLNYIVEKYITVLKLYNENYLLDYPWALPSEERFILELKNVLSYKYKDSLLYIRSMKELLKDNSLYINYIKLLIEDYKKANISSELKNFLPELLNNIQSLIKDEKYQEAYNAIEESLDLVKFDFHLMLLKYQLLIKFNYKKEAKECLRDIILYGDKENVNEIMKFIL